MPAVISHNFEQVIRISGHVYVMRQRRAVSDNTTSETTESELVSLVTGAQATGNDDISENP